MDIVEIYTRDQCGYCRRAKQLLEQKEVPFEEINISQEPHRKDEMIERSGGTKTFPQIFIAG